MTIYKRNTSSTTGIRGGNSVSSIDSNNSTIVATVFWALQSYKIKDSI